MDSIIVFLIFLLVVITIPMIYLISKKLMTPLPRAYTGPDKKKAVYGSTPEPVSGGPTTPEPVSGGPITPVSGGPITPEPVPVSGGPTTEIVKPFKIVAAKSYIKKPPVKEKEDSVEIWKQDSREIFENMVRARDEGRFEMEYEECIREITQYKNKWTDEEGVHNRAEVSDDILDYNERMCDKLFG